MKTSKILMCSVALVWLLSTLAHGAIPILWQADPDGSGVVTNNNSISRVKLTPDKNNVMVFHYNGGASGIPTRVDKLDASTGNFVWPLPGYKTVTKPGERISLNGWVDGSGNLFIMGSWSGNTIWKYDSELATQLCSYTGGSGFEYVMDAINDEFDNIYVSGFTGSYSNDGSRLVKLDSSCNEIWTCLSKNTSDKDSYGRGIALDSNKNVFRVGTDSIFGASDRGRLIGHNASNGAEFLNYTVSETNSSISGITIDSSDYIYIAYCYGYTPSGLERTVVQKLERNGTTANVVWEYRFDDIGMYLGRDAIVKHTENSFYVAFNLRQGGTTLPGIAEFDLDGNLLWKDTIDRPGLWNLDSIDATDNYIYVGLTNYADGSQTQVLCLASMLTVIEATVDIDPDTLNLKSKGEWITCYIELPEGYDVGDIDVSTIMLNEQVPAASRPTGILDYDGDGIAELMVKFSMSAVQGILGTADQAELTVTGELADGTPFEGTDTIRVLR